MRESEVETYLDLIVRLRGGQTRKVKWIGRRGAPDRRVMMKDGPFWAETKAPGEKLDPHQEREHKTMQENGEEVVVFDSISSIFDFFDDRYGKIPR